VQGSSLREGRCRRTHDGPSVDVLGAELTSTGWHGLARLTDDDPSVTIALPNGAGQVDLSLAHILE
jgi:hypothetical protein